MENSTKTSTSICIRVIFNYDNKEIKVTYQELETPHYNKEIVITICLAMMAAFIVMLFIIFDGHSTNKTDELGKPYYYLWSNPAFIATEKTLSNSNKINGKAYWWL